MTVPTVPADQLPNFMPLGKPGKRKYPWATMLPGEGFKFDAAVTLTGARSQVANMMRSLPGGQQFIVRLDAEHNIWCLRIDGLPLEVREQWHGRRAAVVEDAEPVSGEMFAELRETGPHMITGLPRKSHKDAAADEHLVFPEEPAI